MDSNNNFRFFVPFDIEKAKDKDGNEVMKIAGIASTTDRDSDDEVLDPSGFDLSYFMKNGFINWHHQSKDKPEAIIGEPTKAEIRPEGMYVEGMLYNDSKLAHQVYDLAKSLEKSNSKRRLGFSIEGKVIERDAVDEKYVKKAKITGLAITPTPKNASTLVDIIKGRRVTEFEPEIVEIEPAEVANGGNQYIIDITKPNGDRITVDSNYNIKVLSKSTDTSNAGNLSPADVEGKLKDLQNYNKNTHEKSQGTENLHKFVTLNKSVLFDEILKATDNVQLTKTVVNSINFKNMKAKEVKLDDLVKALQDIGVEVDPTLLKSEDNDADDKNGDKDKKDEDIEKAKKLKKDEGADEDSDKEKNGENGKDNEDVDEDEKLEKAIKDKEKELELLKSKKVKKAEGQEGDKKDEDEPGDENDDEKSERQKVEAAVAKKMGDVQKSHEDEMNKTVDTFNKGLADLTSLFKSFSESMNQRLSAIENQPGSRKSVLSARAIEKSFGSPEDENNKGKTKLSISKNRQQISNVLLTKSGLEKGEINDFYANAMQAFEATGTLSKAIVTDLYTNSNILITE